MEGECVCTDKISSSFALTTSKTRDPILGACARQIWLEGAIRDINIKIVHEPGHSIPLSDALSKASIDQDKNTFATAEVKARGLIRLPPILDAYSFFDQAL